MGKYHIFQENTEFTPRILKMGEIYTDSEMCWLEALGSANLQNFPGAFNRLPVAENLRGNVAKDLTRTKRKRVGNEIQGVVDTAHS